MIKSESKEKNSNGRLGLRNAFAITGINDILKYVQMETFSQYYCVYWIYHQMNTAFVNIRYFLQKHENLTDRELKW